MGMKPKADSAVCREEWKKMESEVCGGNGLLLFSRPVLSASLWNLMNCSPPGSSVHWILQVRILEWVAMPSSRGYSDPVMEPASLYVSCTGRWVPYH